MSDDKPSEPSKEAPSSAQGKEPTQGLPEGVPAPPPPKPNIVDPRGQGATYGSREGAAGEKKRKKAKRRSAGSHPTDLLHAPPPRPARRGCCGCVLAMVVVVSLLVAALVAAVAWFGPLRYAAKEGYQIVNLEGAEAIVTEAPAEPTLYLGRIILYEVPETRVPVAFVGVEVVLSGDFWEDASVTATRVVGGASARFAKDLEINALEFEDGGIDLRGELSGRVIKNVQ